MKKNEDFLKWIAEREDGRALLASTSDNFDYEEYVENCEINGIKPKGKNSEAFYNWCIETARMQYDEDIESLKNNKNLQCPIIITGKVGRWDGSHTIVPVLVDSFAEAYDKCMGNDTLDVEIYYNTKNINIVGHHHDASNCFYLWLVKPDANTYTIIDRIAEGNFDVEGEYEKQFLQEITDYLP